MSTEKSTKNPRLPSNRKFGAFFTFMFVTASAYSYIKLSGVWLVPLLAISAILAIVTLAAPHFLTLFNRLWFGLGILMGKIVSPIVLGIIFFLVITPVSLVTRISGRDVLFLKKRKVDSYWVDRQPHGPSPESFKNQF